MTEVKGLENIVSLEPSKKKVFGIEDYTEELENAIPDEDVFAGIYNQNKAVKNFFDALNSRYRAILNLGDAGVGKSSITKGLSSELQKLASGKTITGKFAPQIEKFYNRLKEHQHKDIIALWNPKDYNKPLITKLPAGETSENFRIEMIDASENIQYNVTSTIEDVVADRYIHMNVKDILSRDSFISSLDEMSFSINPKKTKIPYIDLKINDEIDDELTIEFNKQVKKAYNFSKQADFSILESKEIHKKWTDYLLSFPETFIPNENLSEDEKKERRNKLKNKIELMIKSTMDNFADLKENWSEYPDIYNWFDDVKNYVNKPNILRDVVFDVASDIAVTEKLITELLDGNKLSKKAKQQFSTMGHYTFQLNFNKNMYDVDDLLEPNRLYNASEDDGLIIRELSIFEYEDLFGGLDVETEEPVHKNLTLGALATSDIVVVDDDFLPLLKDDLFRRSLLSFLQDGDLKILYEKVEIEVKNDCYFIVNDTQFPFMRQDFENVPPKEDSAMSRRFNTIEWDPFVENTYENRKNFPAIIKRSIDNFRKRNNVENEISFDAYGLNMILQYILAENNNDLLPMQIGSLEKILLEPVVNRVLDKGKLIVSGRDIIKYVQEQKDDLFANLTLDQAKQEYNHDYFKPRIGTGNCLGVQGEFGSVFLASAAITGKKGEITSIDNQAKMTDETNFKGIMNASSWVQNAFGPINAEINLSYHGFGGVAGPSSSAIQTYIVMSALGNIPMKQNVFVTGTMLDRDGDVGPIGGVYEKVLGAYKFYEMNKGDNPEPCEVLIPKTNVKELIRKIDFDDFLHKACDDGKLVIKYHDNIWNGFKDMTDLPREEYEPMIKKGIKNLNRTIAKNEFVNKYLPFMAK